MRLIDVQDPEWNTAGNSFAARVVISCFKEALMPPLKSNCEMSILEPNELKLSCMFDRLIF